VAPVDRRRGAALSLRAVVEHAASTLPWIRRHRVPGDTNWPTPFGLRCFREIPVELQEYEGPFAVVVDELNTTTARVRREAGVRAAAGFVEPA
jgi:hypothetical protein